MKKSQRRLFTFSPDTQSTLAALLLLTGGFTMVAVLIYFLATADERISAVVVTSEDIGRLQSARFIGRFIHRETQIETEKGVFLVRGVFPVLKGNALVLEHREDGVRMLCDPEQNHCRKLN